MHLKKLKKSQVILCIIFIFSLLIRGYKFGSGNHAYQIPLIKSFANDLLYSGNDLFFKFPLENSLYYRMVGYIVKYINIETFMLITYIISSFIFILMIYKIAKLIFKSENIGLIAALISITPIQSMGTEFTFRNIAYHITIVIPLLLISIFFLLKDKHILSLVVLGVSFNIYALASIYLIGLYGLYYLMNIKYVRKKQIVIGIILLIIIISPLFLSYGKGNLFLLSAEHYYVDSIKQIDKSHSFPSNWSQAHYLTGFSIIALIISTLLYLFKNGVIKKDNTHKKILFLLLGIPIYLIIGIIFTEIYPIEIVIALQLFRSTIFLALFAIIYLSVVIADMVKKENTLYAILIIFSFIFFDYLLFIIASFVILLKTLKISKDKKYLDYLVLLMLTLFSIAKIIGTGNAIIAILLIHIGTAILLTTLVYITIKLIKKEKLRVIIILILVISVIAIFIEKDITNIKEFTSKQFQIKKSLNEWEKTQTWAKENTKIDANFLTPIYRNGFRVYSERSVYLENDLGFMAYFSKDFLTAWLERLNSINKTNNIKNENLRQIYNSLEENKIRNLSKENKINFVVFEKPKELDLPKVYENKGFIIYCLTC